MISYHLNDFVALLWCLRARSLTPGKRVGGAPKLGIADRAQAPEANCTVLVTSKQLPAGMCQVHHSSPKLRLKRLVASIIISHYGP
ncbi:hypothetical protein C7212DRAFT_323499 [Tuber magnatum]|uniref:Uncharacterized protein n=1 Tax=Tuber magnatum TaxID=42249 RepID=A0A317SVB1_9PEZI|nr:hypothetical protein C7212DRAFT_323499 [Tuber magnatum]